MPEKRRCLYEKQSFIPFNIESRRKALYPSLGHVYVNGCIKSGSDLFHLAPRGFYRNRVRRLDTSISAEASFALFYFFILVCWMMAAFGKGEETLWEWAWFHVTTESLTNGLTIALRMLGFVTYGLLFTSTTDLTKFIMSLIHQCRLSPKWAYGLLAGFRFVPLFQSELSQMKAAHKIRGYKQKNSWKAFIRYSLPLFSQGIRKSERIAIAMEARGFTGTRNRTYYQTTRLEVKDIIYGFALLIAVLGILAASS